MWNVLHDIEKEKYAKNSFSKQKNIKIFPVNGEKRCSR